MMITNINPIRPDKRSFILGMITAFCECVAVGCKKLALSPPLTPQDYGYLSDEVYEVIRKHGLVHYHELNEDILEEKRFEWILIAAKWSTIDEYKALREQGFSPVMSLAPFSELLSYNAEESIHTGYDAFREYFPDVNQKTSDYKMVTLSPVYQNNRFNL